MYLPQTDRFETKLIVTLLKWPWSQEMEHAIFLQTPVFTVFAFIVSEFWLFSFEPPLENLGG